MTTPEFSTPQDIDPYAAYKAAFTNVLTATGDTAGFISLIPDSIRFHTALTNAEDARLTQIRSISATDLHFGTGCDTGEVSHVTDRYNVEHTLRQEWRLMATPYQNPYTVLRLCFVEYGRHAEKHAAGAYIARNKDSGELIPFTVTKDPERPWKPYRASVLEGEAADTLLGLLARTSDRLTTEQRTRHYTAVLHAQKLGSHTYTEENLDAIHAAFAQAADPRLQELYFPPDPEGNFHQLTHSGPYGQELPGAYPNHTVPDASPSVQPIWAAFHPPHEQTHGQRYDVLRLLYINSNDGRYLPQDADGLYLVRHHPDSALIPVVVSGGTAMEADAETAAFLFEQLELAVPSPSDTTPTPKASDWDGRNITIKLSVGGEPVL